MKNTTESKNTPTLEMNPEEFREIGHKIIDRLADYLSSIPEIPVTSAKSPSQIKKILGDSPLPQVGKNVDDIMEEILPLIFEHSLFDGHPKFLGYITSSPAPIGALGDLIASVINPNVAAWALSPVASEMERQTIRWIAEMIGYPVDCGGILVSGGNMANLLAFLTARHIKSNWDVKSKGMLADDARKQVFYASTETHSWINKAATLFGNGTDSVRWIKPDSEMRMDSELLYKQIKKDIGDGLNPFLVVGTCGSVGTGAIDPLLRINEICNEFNLWFHVDGAYGAFAAALPDAPEELQALQYADSIALDPHKWLYNPLEVGCTLVRDSKKLKDTFSYHPKYYKFEEFKGEKTDSYFDFGIQNSRGFRALKVWLGFKQAGKSGYVKMISENIRLAKLLYELSEKHPELESFTRNLSITTFRYRPQPNTREDVSPSAYLNELNMKILTQLQESGMVFVSNAWVNDNFLLRACIVNFRTTAKDIEEIVEIIVDTGRRIHSQNANH